MFYSIRSGFELNPNWNAEYLDADYDFGMPFILDIITDRVQREKAFSLIDKAQDCDINQLLRFPGDYGYDLYICPKCKLLNNHFYFKISTSSDSFEPHYICSACESTMKRCKTKSIMDQEARSDFEKWLSYITMDVGAACTATNERTHYQNKISAADKYSFELFFLRNSEVYIAYRNHMNARWTCPECTNDRLIRQGGLLIRWD